MRARFPYRDSMACRNGDQPGLKGSTRPSKNLEWGTDLCSLSSNGIVDLTDINRWLNTNT